MFALTNDLHECAALQRFHGPSVLEVWFAKKFCLTGNFPGLLGFVWVEIVV